MRNPNRQRDPSTLADTQPSRPRGPDRADGRERLELLLHEARTAPSTEAALEYVERAMEMRPDDPRVQATLQLSLFRKLASDAFLAFLAETDRRYVISFRNSRPFTVPKARNDQEAYPPAKRTDAEKALSMMWWMLLGLVPAGLGAVILSPFAIRRGISALQKDYRDPRQHRMAWAAILVAFLLGLLGLFFAALLLLHFLLGL